MVMNLVFSSICPIFSIEKNTSMVYDGIAYVSSQYGRGVFMFKTDSSIPKNDDFNNPAIGKNSSETSPLVEYAKSSAPNDPSTPENAQFLSVENGQFSHRTARYYAQNLMAQLIFGYSAKIFGKSKKVEQERKKFHRTITCLRSPIASVRIHRSVKFGKTFYSGLCTCGNVWTCPVCAAKIQSRRRLEILKLFKWVYEGKYKQIAMVTITFPHKSNDTLADNLEKHAKALEIFRTYNNKTTGLGYKKFKNDVGYEGFVRGLEVTHGLNGWHPHTHELWILDYWEKNEKRENEIREYLVDRWQHSCIKVGLLSPDDEGQIKAFREHSINIVFRAKDSDYIAKQNNEDDETWKSWGVDREIAHSSTKIGRASGKSPFQMLLLSENDKKYKSLMIEFVLAIKGKMQMFWVTGLKGKVGIVEKTDEQLASEMDEPADMLAILEREHWAEVVKAKARAELLDICENGGFEGLQAWFAVRGIIVNPPSIAEQEDWEKDCIEKTTAKKVATEKRNKRKKIVVHEPITPAVKEEVVKLTASEVVADYDSKYEKVTKF